MNTIRIGLASIIFMLCAQHANKLKGEWKLWVPFVSLCFHYSMLFPGFYRWAAMFRWKLKSVFIALIILLCFACVVFFNTDYFTLKLIAMKDVQSPSKYSGISKVIIISILLSGLWLSKAPKQIKIPLMVFSSVLIILIYGLSFYTYSALRVLELIAFVLPIIILNIYKSYNLRFCLSLRTCFFLAGLISFATFYRNIYSDIGVGETPFLPYEFIFF